jgi:hypothetical protein
VISVAIFIGSIIIGVSVEAGLKEIAKAIRMR